MICLLCNWDGSIWRGGGVSITNRLLWGGCRLRNTNWAGGGRRRNDRFTKKLHTPCPPPHPRPPQLRNNDWPLQKLSEFVKVIMSKFTSWLYVVLVNSFCCVFLVNIFFAVCLFVLCALTPPVHGLSFSWIKFLFCSDIPEHWKILQHKWKTESALAIPVHKLNYIIFSWYLCLNFWIHILRVIFHLFHIKKNIHSLVFLMLSGFINLQAANVAPDNGSIWLKKSIKKLTWFYILMCEYICSWICLRLQLCLLQRHCKNPINHLCAQQRLRSAWASASLIRVFAVRMKKPWAFSYQLSA